MSREDYKRLPSFDFAAFAREFDAQRQACGLTWFEFADDLWDQSSELNSSRPEDNCLCGGAISRLAARGRVSCQYALFILRWLRKSPEDFLVGAVVDVGDTTLPIAGPQGRLRWNLAEVHAALNDRRQQQSMTWVDLADTLGCTPNRLTNLQTARLADLDLMMRVTQWLGKPAAAYIHAASW